MYLIRHIDKICSKINVCLNNNVYDVIILKLLDKYYKMPNFSIIILFFRNQTLYFYNV